MFDRVSEETIAAFLCDPLTWGGKTGGVEVIETHVSRVILLGNRAYKQKRHVKFPYADLTTTGERRKNCEAEIAINRRTAPSLYKKLIAVCVDQRGRFHLDGPGEIIDWLIEMDRFDQNGLFDRMASAGSLNRKIME